MADSFSDACVISGAFFCVNVKSVGVLLEVFSLVPVEGVPCQTIGQASTQKSDDILPLELMALYCCLAPLIPKIIGAPKTT